jgi:hypothetical protein
MYNTLYYLIKYLQYDENNYTGCSYNKYTESNIKSQLIMITLEKEDIFNYFGKTEIPNNYIIKEYSVSKYKNFYKYSELYIIFYNNFNNLLCADGDINIDDIIFDYHKMSNYLQDRHFFTSLKCNINKSEKILYGYYTTRININILHSIYNIENYIFSELDNCPRVMFLTINNNKIPFPEENHENFENRILMYNEYNHQIKLIKEENERIKLENEKINIELREENQRRIERANKFLELSTEKQEEILNLYH